MGSSNLDPLSLSLNLEANVVIRDRGFARQLTARLEHMMQHSCKQISHGDLVESSRWRTVRSFFLFHLLRRYPAWAGWLPAHVPRLTPALSLRSAVHPETSTEASATLGPDSAGADHVNQADPA